ncbi:hypothetical protein ACIBLA_23280 [Streptomyces sp. NPDC050433]|uniref:hypothetical protein n=1 Tax=Streptomyces sp. NPDC050433 TaxID=3365615 RepID=UPI0037AE50CB
MDSTADMESARADAGTALQFYWEAAEHELPEELADDEAEVGDAYAAVQESVPDDPTALSCLTLFALGRLRAHLNEEFGATEDHFEAAHHPPAELAPDDGPGRALAADVVRAADRALSRRPADNLAVFSRACALHWLGDHRAAAAYREAVRLDPYDDIARTRVEQLDGIELPEPPGGFGTHHPHGFHLLEMTHLVGHGGSTKGWVWLVNDPSTVRDKADGHLAEWLALRGHSLDDDFGVWTHVPGGQGVGSELREALHHPPEGRPYIDWSKVPLPRPERDPLPVGQPIRWLGQLHFYGGTEHDD